MWHRLHYLKSLTEDGVPLIVALNVQEKGANNVLATMSMFSSDGYVPGIRRP